MADSWGNYIRYTLFGESHGAGIGITIDGLPAGIKLDETEIAREMARRAPGKSPVATARKEADIPEILSGYYQGRTTGTCLTAIIRNTNQHSSDYGASPDVLRPGHADYTGNVRYGGWQDFRGGGHFSGRLTAPIVFAGAVMKQYLAAHGIAIYAHVLSVMDVSDRPFSPMADDVREYAALSNEVLPTLDKTAGEKMQGAILAAKSQGDSVGGVIECIAAGIPAGLGAPFFDSAESQIAHAMFSVPGVKGIEFGLGFEHARKTGSECNDEMRYLPNGNIEIITNRAGGINGGITNGNPLLFRVAMRPTPSIAKKQMTVSLQNKETVQAATAGRHDPCIVPRAVPVIEAMTAMSLAEMWKERLTWIS